jgi:hypothetical protein
MYSGGNPFSVEITKEQSSQILQLFSNAIKNKEIHQETRSKGTGMIIKMNGKTSENTIIKMNSTEKATIEKWLKELKK